jgi:hypothetical protein
MNDIGDDSLNVVSGGIPCPCGEHLPAVTCLINVPVYELTC